MSDSHKNDNRHGVGAPASTNSSKQCEASERETVKSCAPVGAEFTQFAEFARFGHDSGPRFGKRVRKGRGRLLPNQSPFWFFGL